MISATPHSRMRPGWAVVNSSSAAIADGPATPGMASGTMNGSPPLVLPKMRLPSAGGNTRRMPIKKSTMPPAMLTESCLSCSNCRMYWPPTRKPSSTTSAINSSRTITKRRRLGGTSLSRLRNSWILPSGSITRNSRMPAESAVMCDSMVTKLQSLAGSRSYTGQYSGLCRRDRPQVERFATQRGAGGRQQVRDGLCRGIGQRVVVRVLGEPGLAPQGGAHGTRQQRMHAHGAGIVFIVQDRRQALQAGLGHAVGAPVGGIEFLRIVGDEHHGAVRAGGEQRLAGLGQREWRRQVDLQGTQPFVGTMMVQWRQRVEVGGAMHQPVEMAELALDRGGHFLVLRRRGLLQIEWHDGRLRGIHGLQLVVQFFQLAHAMPGQYQRRAGAGHRARHGAPQPAGGADDQHDATGQAFRARRRNRAAHQRQAHASLSESMSLRIRASSPAACNSSTMSQPPISSPWMNNCGNVDQLA